MAGAEEPSSAVGMVKAIAKASDGTNVMKETAKTFSMWGGGKNKKSDVMHPASDMAGALGALQAQVSAARAEAKEKKRAIWDFRTSPHAHMGKNLDDTFRAFLMWARTGDPDAEEGDEEAAGAINVSKAFRRLESYAEWMEETGDDLTSKPLTYASVATALKAWCMSTSHDQHGRLIWWVDFARLDKAALSAIPPEESLRAFVWYAHAVMYDGKAQANGIAFVENVAQIGFWASMTLVPMKLSVKLDRLTIGVLPVKMKLILILDCPTWMDVLVKMFSVFMSKKMRSRMVLLKKEWHVVAERFGQPCIPAGFGECGGSLATDPVLVAYQ